MKKVLILFLGIAVAIIIVFGYVQYKFTSAEKAVIGYLNMNKKLPEENIKTHPFIANLSGSKNWMVCVTIKNDTKKYYYYLNNYGEVVLESYADENGEGAVLNQIVN